MTRMDHFTEKSGDLTSLKTNIFFAIRFCRERSDNCLPRKGELFPGPKELRWRRKGWVLELSAGNGNLHLLS